MDLQRRGPAVRRIMVTHESVPAGFEADEHELLVMNLEIGRTGIVPVWAASQDEAISMFERSNPSCVVISALAPGS